MKHKPHTLWLKWISPPKWQPYATCIPERHRHAPSPAAFLKRWAHDGFPGKWRDANDKIRVLPVGKFPRGYKP